MNLEHQRNCKKSPTYIRGSRHNCRLLRVKTKVTKRGLFLHSNKARFIDFMGFQVYRFKLVDPTEVFVDATHVKARADNKKMQKRIAKQEALFYTEMLRKDIRHTEGMKDLYSHRKETIERIFGTAKENHGFRYKQMYGKARMIMKVALAYSAMNLKKLTKIKNEWGLQSA